MVMTVSSIVWYIASTRSTSTHNHDSIKKFLFYTAGWEVCASKTTNHVENMELTEKVFFANNYIYMKE